MSLFDFIKSFYGEEVNMYHKSYEDKLYKKYGKCENIKEDITLLIIADTHGTLNEEKFLEFINQNTKYDACIMLGDHYDRDINIILKYVDKNKLYGILGNHDYNYLDNYDIKNINGDVIEINGIKIMGMEGSFRYKPVKFPSFSQEESIEFFQNMDSVDILISHDTKFNLSKCNRDPAHQGLVGITNYLYEKKVPIHIHGHIHENYDNKLLNDTLEYSVFGYKVIEIKKTS
jgi:predicted phosphodiesterase